MTNATRTIALGVGAPIAEPLAPRDDVSRAGLGDGVVWDETRRAILRISAEEPYMPPSTRVRSLEPEGAWIELAASGSPGLRWAPAVSDARRDRVLRFGGHAYVESDATFVLEGERWRELAIEGERPSARALHASVLDPRSERLVVLLGASQIGSLDDRVLPTDAWALDDTTRWTRLAIDGGGPSGRVGAIAIAIPDRDRAIVLGGADWSGGPELRDAWWLSIDGDTARWERIAASGEAPVDARGAWWDAARERLIVIHRDDGIVRASALDLAGDAPRWRRFCDRGVIVRQHDTGPHVASTPEGPVLVTATGDALVAFDPATSLCDGASEPT